VEAVGATRNSSQFSFIYLLVFVTSTGDVPAYSATSPQTKITHLPYTTEHFLDYIRAFNIPDWDKQHAFYAKDVTLDLPPNGNLLTLKGSEGIKGHYRTLFGGFLEKIVPIDVLVEDDRIFFWMETNFLATKPGPAPGGFTVEAGDIVRVTVWAHYVVEGDLMKTIVTNQLKGELIGKTMAMEEAIKDSQTRTKKPEFLLQY